MKSRSISSKVRLDLISWTIAALLTLLAAGTPGYGLDVPPLQGRVNDRAGILSQETVAALEERLAGYEKATTAQIALLVVDTLDGEDLEHYSLKVAMTWQLGQRKKDNGVLLLVAVRDRLMRIEVGKGLEGDLTDISAGRIIRNDIAPSFKQEQYDEGITRGITAIINTIGAKKYVNGSGESPAEESDGETTRETRNSIDAQVSGMSVQARVIIGVFVFSVLGIFTFLMIFMQGGMGIFLFFFLIPFWSIFPMMAVGARGELFVIGTYVIGAPVLKLLLKYTAWGKRLVKKMNIKGGGRAAPGVRGLHAHRHPPPRGAAFPGEAAVSAAAARAGAGKPFLPPLVSQL